MGTAAKKVWRFLPSRLAFFLLVAAIATPAADHPNPSDSQAPVTSVTQITRDGVSKTSLLSDESNLYVTEWPAARHLVARISLQGSDRAVISGAFPNVQALDISPDGSKLLVTPIQGGGDSEFWTLPVHTGSPQRLGELTGRDGAWSVDGQQLVIGKGSKLYLADENGAAIHELFNAHGSVFGTRFSPDGKRTRFTVGNMAQNATSIWEVARDGSNPHPPSFCYLKPYYLDQNTSYFEQLAKGAI